MLRQHAIALRAVEVVGVDHGKRPIDLLRPNDGCVQRSPWLRSALRDSETGPQAVEFLEGIRNAHALLEPGADGSFEGLLDLFADDKDDLAKAGADRVEDRVITMVSPAALTGTTCFSPP